MRALLTLIKRQLVDNTVYFLAAIIFSVVLVVAILSITFSEEFLDLSLNTIILIIIMPILFGIGSYILGVIQTYSDKTSGITQLLSVLPVTNDRIFFARLITCILVILTLFGPLVITGAILWEFFGPPDWLYHNWLGGTFIGLSLASLACYCLGLIAAQRTETFTSALRALPLVPILMLLIVIKGFGWPLLVVLLPILAFLLLLCFKPNSNRFMTIITTGFIVLALSAIPLYFGRNVCNGSLVTKMDAEATVSPSGLLPPEIENDPNVDNHSEAYSRINFRYRYRGIVHNILGSSRYYKLRDCFKASPYILENSGIIEYFRSRERGIRLMYSPKQYRRLMYLIHLDKIKGQLIYRRMITDTQDDQYTWQWKEVTEIFAGPQGVSKDRNNIGRFSSPIIYLGIGEYHHHFLSYPPCLVYDKHFRCFYDIDFENQIVRKGPNLPEYIIHPFDIGLFAKSDVSYTGFTRPRGYRLQLPITDYIRISYLPIVDELGQINLLDPNKLEFHGLAGHLPHPKTLFGRGSEKPIDLFDYDMDPIAILLRDERQTYSYFPIDSKTKGGYLGLVVGSLSRQGLWTSVAVYDKDGKKIKSADSKSTFFNVPGGPTLTITKYIIESLHPPVLTLASFFTAYSFDARSTHRALFLMPNSFVAMARDYEGNIFYKFLLVLLLMLPGILFASLLGWRVTRDASTIGLSNKSKRIWLAGTLVFGLPAYITYRLTRPKVMPVTCANCGKPRRPDLDICHRCGSKWDVSELTPPKWRVLNGDTVEWNQDIRELCE